MTEADLKPRFTQAPASPGPQVSVVVPTFNERGNVEILTRKLEAALSGIAWEVIFVDDDSPDRTWDLVRTLAAQDSRVRCLRRLGRRGLAGACIEGIMASSAPYVAVLDADLQHDEMLLPRMLEALRQGRADLVVGSRYVAGGSAESFTQGRLAASRISGFLARSVLRVELTDPMSGFFMMRRDRFETLAPALSVHGFKILLDIAATAGTSLRVVELPYTFRGRLHGESKLDSRVAFDFLGLLLAKLTGDAVSLRFVLFAVVGVLGLLVHVGVLYFALDSLALSFGQAQTLAAVAAMTANFLLDNLTAFRDRRLKGLALLRGLVLFYLVCSVGAVANVGVAFSIYGQRPVWWLAGVAGALMGVVWNYAMSSLFVRRRR